MKHTTFIFSTISLFVIFFFFVSCDKDEYLDWKYLNETWLEQHSNDEDWIIDSSGLQYKVNYEGILEERPTDRSFVAVKCTGWYISGTILQETDTIVGAVSSFVSGVQQVLKKMKLNSQYEMRIPYELGYGSEGNDGNIPPYTTLIFSMELIDFYSYNPNEQ